MPRPTRHELKQDEFRTTVEQFEQFAKKYSREIVAVAILLVIVGGLAGGLKAYMRRQEAEANQQLAAALGTFHAYVGPSQPGALGQGTETFSTYRDKYREALEEFLKITQIKGLRKFLPEPKAVAIARYHVGLCQAELGDDAAAIKTLEQASRTSDPSIASLAKFAWAGELMKIGKLQEAVKLYQELASHPTLAVPKPTVLLAEADAYRATRPAQARQIYEQLQKEFGSNPLIAEVLKQQIASLPKPPGP